MWYPTCKWAWSGLFAFAQGSPYSQFRIACNLIEKRSCKTGRDQLQELLLQCPTSTHFKRKKIENGQANPPGTLRASRRIEVVSCKRFWSMNTLTTWKRGPKNPKLKSSTWEPNVCLFIDDMTHQELESTCFHIQPQKNTRPNLGLSF